MPHAVSHYLKPVKGIVEIAEGGGFNGVQDIIIKGDKIVYNMKIFIIILLKPGIVVIIIDVGNGKEKLLLAVEMMIKSAAGGA